MTANDKVREALDADRRLLILRLLKEYGDGLNTSTLETAVFAWGHRSADRHVILRDVRWLEQAGTVRLDTLKPDLYMVTITTQGEQVQAGDRHIPGIARPS